MPTLSWRRTFETVLPGEAISSAFSDVKECGWAAFLHPSDCAEEIFQKICNPPRARMPFSMSVGRRLRRLRIFGQRDKLRLTGPKRGMISGRKEEAAQRGIQSAGGDGGAFGGEDPGGAVGGGWSSSDDDQRLEAGAGEACGRAVCARQQGAGGRGWAEGDL